MRSLPASGSRLCRRGVIASRGSPCSPSMVTPRSTFDQPLLFLSLLPCRLRHLGVQGQPAARQGRLDDVGLVRGRLRGAACCSARNETMLVGVASAWCQCTFRMRRRTRSIGRCSAWRAWRSPCRPPALPTSRSAASLARSAANARTVAPAARRRGHDVFRLQHLPDCGRHRAVDARSRSSACGTRTSSGARRAISSAPAWRCGRRGR